MQKLLATTGLFALVALSGCATLFGGGGTQKMSFDSAPEGATVVLNGNPIGLTPLSTIIVRDKNAVVTFKKDGYQQQTYVLEHHLNPWFWGDVVATSLLSSSVDSTTNATVEYSPDHYYATLVASNTPAVQSVDKRTQVSQFIVLNYAAIGQEIDALQNHPGGTPGEHIATLVDMLNVLNLDKKSTMHMLKDLYTDNKTAPGFANAVIARFGL